MPAKPKHHIGQGWGNAENICAYLNIGLDYLHKLEAEHGLPCTRIGRRSFYSYRLVDEWLVARQQSSDDLIESLLEEVLEL